jgi:photosystem II PsbZ protein
MTIVFQIVLAALVLFSFVMLVGVPVLYASPQSNSKQLLFLGSGIWAGLVVVVAVLNFLVA